MKHFSLYLAGLTSVLVCLAPRAVVADDYDKKTVVTISAPVEVPGTILEPGTYVIKLLNSSSNRHIAEIMNERMDHLYALTFTVAAEKITRTGKTVLTFYEGTNGRPIALRKWFWPGDTIGQEFIYPKEQAARISAAMKERVPEGNLPTVAESRQSLTPDNAKSLSPDATSSTARAAEPEKAPEPQRSPEPSVSVIAQNAPPSQTQRVEETRQSDSVAANGTSTTTLPQTASPLPLIGAIGIGSLVLAVFVGLVRRYRSVSDL